MSSLKSIAQQLGISKSTVSRALKDHPRIGLRTRELVKSVAAALDYTPSEMAINFKKKQTKIIGVIIPDVSVHFHGKILSGIQDIAFEMGYQVVLCQSHEQESMEQSQIVQLTKMGVDGFILALSMTSVHLKLFQKLREKNYPFVFVDRRVKGYPAVYSDDINGAKIMTQHILSHGFDSICMLNAPVRIQNALDRETGFLQAIQQASSKPAQVQIIYSALDPESNIEAFANMHRSQPQVQAVFCYNDYLAYDCIKYLQNNGLKHVSVFGYGHEPISHIHVPNIPTVDQSPYHMGQMAAQLLLNWIVYSNVPPENSYTSVRLLDAKNQTANNRKSNQIVK